ncbi:DUF3179 domain-containing protein [Verrucomicrobia bacterium]|nr:DUF3179 domain-containing protein [Verrucomicrobiota bacterium]MDB4688885.1 DUF3179 domain-containing protein [Verrucomicrobiota bacterium]
MNINRLSIGGGIIGLMLGVVLPVGMGAADANSNWIIKPHLFESLTEPPCSYVSTENRKGFVKPDDKVIAWLRGPHNGGTIPLRHFLSGPRIINDTYGLFFYDPEGGYVASYQKDYGYEFYGWRDGVMLVRDKEGTIWSALSGRALDGPRKGQQLKRVPSAPTTWGHWLMLHPESTAYNLFEGDTYSEVKLPAVDHWQVRAAARIAEITEDLVIGVEGPDSSRAYPLPLRKERVCYNDVLDNMPITVFWYGPTQSGVAWKRTINGKLFTFRADMVAPETAPFMDNETNSRWTLAGRAVDGPMRGTELEWISSIQCRDDAWKAEYPETFWFKPDTQP